MPNIALRQAQQDVPVDSSPATPDSDTQDTPVPDAGNHSGDTPPAQSGRTVEQVRGEFDRKFKDLQNDLTNRFSRLEEMLTSRAPAPTSSADSGEKDLNSMSVAELEALRPHIPADKKDAFEQLVRTRREEERVDSRVDRKLEGQRLVETRKQANADAYARFPELYNENGALYREVNKVLDQWGDVVTKKNPYSVLQAATEAAFRLGIKPRVPDAPTPTHGHSRTAPAPDGAGGPAKMSKAEAEKIASRLANALPPGKKFDLENVINRTQQYNEHRDLFIRK